MQRQTDKGLPQYNDADTFLDWTGEELVHTSEGYYRCENEGLFARFQRTNGFWIATLRDGTRFVFGQSSQARLERVPGETCCWQLELSEDLNGNRVAYRYTNHLNQLYPREIEYGLHATEPSGTYRVVLDYSEDRPDPIVDYRPRFRCETRWRLTGVTVFHQQRRIRHWRFAYQTNSPVSLPASVTMFGDDRSQLGPSAKVNVDFLPPTTFDYTEARLGESWRMMTNQLNFDLHFTTGDAEFVDLNRDGLPDLIFELNGELLSALNHGPSRPWGEVKPVAGATVGTRLRQASTRLVDLSGDGAVKYLAQLPGDTAYFYRAFRSPTRLDDPVTFEIDGNLRLGSADVQFVDINHDKAIDLIFTADDGPAFLINQAKSSQAGRAARLFVPPRDPTMVGVRFSAGWQLADMNGDRLLDLVFIGTVEEGGTQVRLSRGWGEFEPAFTMTGDPRERAGDLGPRGKGGLSLVDINQDGLSDLVLVESGVVKVWLNQAGTAWAPPIVIDDSNLLPSQRRIPEFDANTTTVRFADLNGSGSVDIVWHQQGRAELVALDFSAQAKPYQFKRVTTGMGRGLEIAYKSSTEDMLAALGSTNAWTVVPPFAVQVVAATEETDGLGGRYRTELTYRNGYYDGYEKEFRGFEVARRREVGNDAQGAPALVTEFHFDTGATVEALKGKPLLVEARTESDAVFHREANDWITRRLPIQQAAGESRFVTFPFRQRQTTQLVELGPEDRSVTLLQEFQFDDYGNEILMADYGRVEGTNRLAWGDERIKTRRFSAEFPSGQQLWLLDQLVEEEIRNGTNR